MQHIRVEKIQTSNEHSFKFAMYDRPSYGWMLHVTKPGQPEGAYISIHNLSSLVCRTGTSLKYRVYEASICSEHLQLHTKLQFGCWDFPKVQFHVYELFKCSAFPAFIQLAHVVGKDHSANNML